MPNRKDLIHKRLLEEGQKTAAYFLGLTEAQLNQQVYVTGPEWRARSLIAHLVSTERSLAALVRDVLAGGPGAPEGFDIDAFNAAQAESLKNRSIAELVQTFEACRADMLEIVAGMADTDFDRIGRHPWFGQTTLENVLKLVYRHTMLHQRDAHKAIETGQPVPHVEASPTA
jgi:uncharacterized protein (TIGR03083 family)